MWIIAAVVIGFLMDCIFGDPVWLPHPVRLIGWWISTLERVCRRCSPKTPGGERLAGIAMTLGVLLLTGATAAAILWLSAKIHRWVGFVAVCIMCWQVLAARCLKTEAEKVQHVLEAGDLPGARRQIAMR